MKGQIVDYSVQSHSGAISGHDGTRYQFDGAEWMSDGVPARGRQVDFEVDGDQAKNIYVALAGSSYGAGAQAGTKNKTAAGLLAIFLGSFGVHKFYLGFTGPALVYLLTNTVGWILTIWIAGIPNIILGIMAVIEGIIYLTKTDEEFEQLYIVQKKQWF